MADGNGATSVEEKAPVTAISTAASVAAASANALASLAVATVDGVIDPALYVPHAVRQQRRQLSSFDGDDSINVIEEGDHVGTEDFGLSSAEISMHAPIVTIDSLNAMQQIEALLGAQQTVEAVPPAPEDSKDAATSPLSSSVNIPSATEVVDTVATAAVASTERSIDAASIRLAMAVHHDNKVAQIKGHPLVASVASDGCGVICKCGKSVRLNPPWYLAKLEQHIVSRSCTFLRKKKSKRTQDREAKRRAKEADQLAGESSEAVAESEETPYSGHETAESVSAEDEAAIEDVQATEAEDEHAYGLKDAGSLLRIHAVGATSTDDLTTVEGDTSAQEVAASEIIQTSPIVDALRELQATPNFSRITPDGRFIECNCSALVILSTPWDLHEYRRHVAAKSGPAKEKRSFLNSRGAKGYRFGQGAAYRIEQRLMSRETRWQPAANARELPCPGLRDERVTMFINATTKITGGSRARRLIAEELFPHHFTNGRKSRVKLTAEEKLILHDAVEGEAVWFIDRDTSSIRSLDCRGSMAVYRGQDCCLSCRDLRANVSLKVSLAVAIGQDGSADDGNQDLPFKLSSACKFALLEQEFDIKQVHSRLLRDLFRVDVQESSVKNLWFDVAELGMSGSFASHPAFLGVVESMLMLKDKERRGVGLQNMVYSEHLDAFTKSLSDISIKACEHFQRHLGGRKPRSLLAKKRRLENTSVQQQSAVHGDDIHQAGATDGSASDNFAHLPFDFNTAGSLEADLTSFQAESAAEDVREDADEMSAVDAGGETTEAFLTDENMDEDEPEARAVTRPSVPVIGTGYMPCRGLRDDKVQAFVTNAAQVIGGSRPKYVIAKELFPEVFSGAKQVKMQEKLDEHQRLILLDAIFSECLWRVDKMGSCVRSLRCYRAVDKRRGDGVCRACLSLKSITNFRSLLSRAKTPKKVENLKYVPSVYTESDPFLRKLSKNASLRGLYQTVKREVADESAKKRVVFWLRVAKMGLYGFFRSHAVFAGLVGSMVEVKDRERRGVGRQNMMYAKPLDEFMTELSAISMDAFELFSLHFCGRTIRSQKVKKRKATALILDSVPAPLTTTESNAAASMALPMEVAHGVISADELLNETRPISTAEMEENQRFMDRMLDEVRLSVNQDMHLAEDDKSHHEQDVHMDTQTYLDENGVLNTVL